MATAPLRHCAFGAAVNTCYNYELIFHTLPPTRLLERHITVVVTCTRQKVQH